MHQKALQSRSITLCSYGPQSSWSWLSCSMSCCISRLFMFIPTWLLEWMTMYIGFAFEFVDPGSDKEIRVNTITLNTSVKSKMILSFHPFRTLFEVVFCCTSLSMLLIYLQPILRTIKIVTSVKGLPPSRKTLKQNRSAFNVFKMKYIHRRLITYQKDSTSLKIVQWLITRGYLELGVAWGSPVCSVRNRIALFFQVNTTALHCWVNITTSKFSILPMSFGVIGGRNTFTTIKLVAKGKPANPTHKWVTLSSWRKGMPTSTIGLWVLLQRLNWKGSEGRGQGK